MLQVVEGPEILVYRGGVIEKNALPRHMSYLLRIQSAHWSSADFLTSAAMPYAARFAHRTTRPSLSF
jgi:hypothetical protein